MLDPIKLVIVNKPENWTAEYEGELYPGFPEKGTIKFPLSNEVYIERSDFCEADTAGFWGLSPSQIVMLRYAVYVKLEGVVKTNDGKIDYCKVSVVDKPEAKPKGYLHWVDAKRSINVETRLFDQLFDVENPKDFKEDWLSHYNKDSLKINHNSKWFDMYAHVKPYE